MSELAREAGVSVATISRWESGVSLPCLPELQAALNVLGADAVAQRHITSLIEAPRAAVHLRSSISRDAEVPFEWIPSAGGLLRALRLRRGMTQEEVARRAMVTQSTLSRWEHGEGWPSAVELRNLCHAVGAHGQEFKALAYPKSLAPAYIGQATEFEEVANWSKLVMWNAINGTEPGLTELHFWQLLATLLPNYAKWHDRGRELLGIVLARLSQWYIQPEFGSMGLGKPSRAPEATYFANLAQRVGNGEGLATATIVLAQVASLRGRTLDVGRSLDILRPWSERIVGEPGKWGFSLPADYASWIYRDMSMYLYFAGQNEDALHWCTEAINIARSAIRPVEARLRCNDYAELLIKTGKPKEALEFIHVDPTFDERIELWESILRAEAYVASGDFSTGQQIVSELSPVLRNYSMDTLNRRAHSIELKIKARATVAPWERI